LIHFFKQNKPILKDLIPDNFVDIHSHLLPGIDDGATSIEDTKNLILGLETIGIKKFITTPHVMSDVWKNTKVNILNKKEETLAQLEIPSIKNRFKVAAEYMLDAEFRELIKTERLLTLKDNYVLVEMSYLNPPIQLYDILSELRVAGYQPVLAHPERYRFFQNSLSDYKKLKTAGCYFQLNMLSATGYYGQKIARVTDELLENGFIDFIGSDVHHTRHVEVFYKKIVLKNHAFLPSIFQNNALFNF